MHEASATSDERSSPEEERAVHRMVAAIIHQLGPTQRDSHLLTDAALEFIGALATQIRIPTTRGSASAVSQSAIYDYVAARQRGDARALRNPMNASPTMADIHDRTRPGTSSDATPTARRHKGKSVKARRDDEYLYIDRRRNIRTGEFADADCPDNLVRTDTIKRRRSDASRRRTASNTRPQDWERRPNTPGNQSSRSVNTQTPPNVRPTTITRQCLARALQTEQALRRMDSLINRATQMRAALCDMRDDAPYPTTPGQSAEHPADDPRSSTSYAPARPAPEIILIPDDDATLPVPEDIKTSPARDLPSDSVINPPSLAPTPPHSEHLERSEEPRATELAGPSVAHTSSPTHESTATHLRTDRQATPGSSSNSDIEEISPTVDYRNRHGVTIRVPVRRAAAFSQWRVSHYGTEDFHQITSAEATFATEERSGHHSRFASSGGRRCNRNSVAEEHEGDDPPGQGESTTERSKKRRL